MKQFITGLLMLLAMSSHAQLTPVKLTKFVVQKTTTGIDALWTTSTESNNAFFELQGGVDGINFTTLGRVNAFTSDGYSDLPHDYKLSVAFFHQNGGFGIMLIVVIIGLAVAIIKRKGVGGIAAIAVVATSFAGCSLNNEGPQDSATIYKVYRLSQTDKDGHVTYYFQTN